MENGQLHFSISDTGCGISEEEQKRIFQEFTRLRNAQGQEGFGLGLAITKKLILLLEGDIRIESEAGKGSTFHVYLPLPQAPNTDKKNKREEGIKNFILIDDDRIQLQLTAAMLKRPTIHVTCCEQPEELFRQLEENNFDALLTDIQMPAMNGFDLLDAIRALPAVGQKQFPLLPLPHVATWTLNISVQGFCRMSPQTL